MCISLNPRKFAAVDKMFRSTMSKVFGNPLAIVVMNDENLLSAFNEANKALDSVQNGLNDYLETKRAVFPRFFFLSNDELLDILAETRDPKRVIPHLPKCFEGICNVSLDFTSFFYLQFKRLIFINMISSFFMHSGYFLL